jgi:acyl-CoA synthetase (AMP-forming)/AMP-acid ligase II
MMDAERYITITGRLKEIINRGGEKISPREVDDAIMDHPAVQQIVTFAMPHEKLGEEVAAAIVLREGMRATEQEIRDFAAKKLADFKVPRKILFLQEIPKGATGKLQRIGMAQKLALALRRKAWADVPSALSRVMPRRQSGASRASPPIARACAGR